MPMPEVTPINTGDVSTGDYEIVFSKMKAQLSSMIDHYGQMSTLCTSNIDPDFLTVVSKNWYSVNSKQLLDDFLKTYEGAVDDGYSLKELVYVTLKSVNDFTNTFAEAAEKPLGGEYWTSETDVERIDESGALFGEHDDDGGVWMDIQNVQDALANLIEYKASLISLSSEIKADYHEFPASAGDLKLTTPVQVSMEKIDDNISESINNIVTKIDESIKTYSSTFEKQEENVSETAKVLKTSMSKNDSVVETFLNSGQEEFIGLTS